jgi:hypothetical protein
MKHRYNYSKELPKEMFEDIRELCLCCAKSIAVISNRYNEDPRLICKLFIELFTRISEDVDKAR